MIGLNWVCIILASVSTANLFLGNVHKLLTAAVAAFLAVLMDYLIEPVAIQFGMWSWENNVIPLYNYICWFIFSLLFSWIYLRKASGTNQPARYLYLIWAAFFLSIQLIL
jgi:putative membrane protein